MLKLMVLGNDLPAKAWIQAIAEYCAHNPGAARLVGVAVDARRDPAPILAFCQRGGIPAKAFKDFNSPDTVSDLARFKPDVIFSLGTLQIFGPGILAIPRLGVVNFHNSLLPAHAGSNACTWALVNGDKVHGVTCHLMDRGIDTGDILLQRSFDIPPEATAWELIVGCLRMAELMLKRLLVRLTAGDLEPRPQDKNRRSFHLARDIPNGGWLNFSWPAERVADMVRGLNLGPLHGVLPRARVAHGGRVFCLEKVRPIRFARVAPPGEVVIAEDGRLAVQAGDAVMQLVEVSDQREHALPVEELTARLGIRPGDKLATLATG